MSRVQATPPVRRRVSLQTLVAHHEAGHAILALAVGGTPEQVSIRPQEQTLGRSTQTLSAPPAQLAQVYLAGFAAEHLLLGYRPPQLDRELRFALIALSDSELAHAFSGSAEQDGGRAVRAVLQLGLFPEREILGEIERYYAAARRSLAAVWPAVQMLAKALIEHQELNTVGLLEAIRGIDVLRPVMAARE